ncbi:hypothetical protein FNBNMHLP_00465 [Aeromonas jandaei]
MKSDYSRQVILLCPVCGNSQFEITSEQFYTCSDCRNKFDKEALISENTVSTDAMVEDLKKELILDLEKDLKKMFKRFK